MVTNNTSDISDTGIITHDGAGAFTGSTVTQYGTVIAGTSNAVSSVAPSATVGVPLVSAGAAANPIFGTVSVSGGGTGSTSFTAGSVVFSDGSTLTQDNASLFFDDTNNRLGIGTATPLDTLHVSGAMELDHTAAENDDHAIEIVCDANGFSDVKALDIDYITGALAAGEDDEAIIVNIDESASTGGIMAGYLVLSTAEGSATVNGYETGINVNPVVHESGTFADADSILNKAVDVTAALASGGAGAISIFVADNDTITIGDAAQWGENEIILATGASGAGVAPTFEYSTGGAAFSAFSPADGTNGFRNSGAILWDASTLAGWATATSGNYEIRITRTRNTLSTTPIIDELQIAALTEYKWDKDGNVNLNSLTLATDLAVAEGGTGASTLTGVLTGNGTSAVTANAVTQYGVLLGGASNAVGSTAVGTAGDVLTSNGAGLDPTYQTPTAGTVTDVTGTTNRISSTGGATPQIDIDAAYVGQASITTLGTITTGTWTGTDVAVADGGTGSSTASGARTNLGVAIGSDVQGYDADLAAVAALTGTGMLARTGAATYAERTIAAGSTKISVTNGDGVSGAPTIDATEANFTLDNIGGTLSVSKGGTGATSLTDGYVLLGSGTGAITALDVTAKGSLLVGDGTTDPVALAAGTNDYVLTADSAQASGLKWAAAGGGSMPPKEYWFAAESMQPLETNFAPLTKLEGTNVNVFVRSFDDTTEEYVNGKIQVPGDVDTSGTVTFRAYVSAATAAASKNIGLTFGHLALNDSEDWDPVSPYTEEDSGATAIDATQDDVTEVTWTESITNLGWAANDLVLFRLSRDTGVTDDLTGDLYLFSLAIEIPRA